jgi:hypothetical protein
MADTIATTEELFGTKQPPPSTVLSSEDLGIKQSSPSSILPWLADRFKKVGDTLISYPETANQLLRGFVEAPIKAGAEYGGAALDMATRDMPYKEAIGRSQKLYQENVSSIFDKIFGKPVADQTQKNMEMVGHALGLAGSVADWTDEQVGKVIPKYKEMVEYVPQNEWGQFLQGVLQEGKGWASAIGGFKALGAFRGKTRPVADTNVQLDPLSRDPGQVISGTPTEPVKATPPFYGEKLGLGDTVKEQVSRQPIKTIFTTEELFGRDVPKTETPHKGVFPSEPLVQETKPGTADTGSFSLQEQARMKDLFADKPKPEEPIAPQVQQPQPQLFGRGGPGTVETLAEGTPSQGYIPSKTGEARPLTVEELFGKKVGPEPVVEKQSWGRSGGKEPWEMTQAEYGNIVLHQGSFAKGMKPHIEYVKQALSEGKPVPPEVLAGYPDLVKPIDTPIESIKTYPGDYIKAKTDGGTEFYGDVSKVFENGDISIIPDGGKNPIPIKANQVLGIEKGGIKRSRVEFENEQLAKTLKADTPSSVIQEAVTTAKEKGIPLKEQKKYLLDNIDEAIKTAPQEPKIQYREVEPFGEKRISQIVDTQLSDTVTIDVPGDGTFTVVNGKEQLKNFKDLVAKKFPATESKTAKAPGFPSSRPTGARIIGEDVSYYNDFKPRQEGIVVEKPGEKVFNEETKQYEKSPGRNMMTEDGFYTNGHYAIKATQTDLPKGTLLQSPKEDFKFSKVFPKDLQPAKIVGEYFEGFGKDEIAKAHVISKDGTDLSYNAQYIDSILTKYPNAKPFTTPKNDASILLFKDGKNVVGGVMPVRQTEGLNFKEFIKDQKRLPDENITNLYAGLGGIQEFWGKHGEDIKGATKELFEAYKRSPQITETKKTIGEYTGALQIIEHDLSKLAKDINSRIPTDRQ